MTLDDHKESQLHPALRPVLRLELAQQIAPLGPEYYMHLQALNRSVQIFVDGSPKGTSC